VERSRTRARELVEEAKAAVEGLPEVESLRALADYILERKS
jgi:geranylgeranyl pyrophosphate synthase